MNLGDEELESGIDVSSPRNNEIIRCGSSSCWNRDDFHSISSKESDLK